MVFLGIRSIATCMRTYCEHAQHDAISTAHDCNRLRTSLNTFAARRSKAVHGLQLIPLQPQTKTTASRPTCDSSSELRFLSTCRPNNSSKGRNPEGVRRRIHRRFRPRLHWKHLTVTVIHMLTEIPPVSTPDCQVAITSPATGTTTVTEPAEASLIQPPSTTQPAPDTASSPTANMRRW